MIVSLYPSLVEKIMEKGEVRIPLIDCDAQFDLEDVLRERGIQYKKFVSIESRYSANKFLVYKRLRVYKYGVKN